jgi:protein-tyrosine phosphatase
MIDIHCHLIPGVDDGPATMEEALALCAASVSNGITHAICTPHILLGRYDNTINTLIDPFAELQNQLKTNSIPLKLSLSAEVRLDVSILNLLEKGEIPLMRGNLKDQESNYLLLELPDSQIPLGSEKLVSKLLSLNITPIIAHPERNKEIMRDTNRLLPFTTLGCKLQITAGSLVGQFGEWVEEVSWRLIETNNVIAVASDAHNLKGRSPKMAEARDAIFVRYGERMAEYLTFRGPSQLFKVFNIKQYA